MSPSASISLEGRLTVRLDLDGGGVARAVAVASQRPVTAARVFAGKTPTQILTLLPLVFSLCGKAQRAAGLLAVERALGAETGEAQMAARGMIVTAEAAAENARRILMDWPRLVGRSAELPLLLPIRSALAGVEAALYPRGDAVAIGGGDLAGYAEAQIAAARTAIIDAVGADGFSGWDDWAAWRATGDGPVAEVFRLLGDAPGGLGQALDPLTARDIEGIAARLGGPDAVAEGFMARPDLGGACRESGPFARHRGHPAVAEAVDRLGPGVVPRMLARLIDLLDAPAALRRRGDGWASVEAPTDGAVVAMVDTARGWLTHRVALADGGLVGDYRILAPTEWNFHPRGLLPAVLTGQRFADAGAARRAVDLWVTALDPCVACDIDFGAVG